MLHNSIVVAADLGLLVIARVATLGRSAKDKLDYYPTQDLAAIVVRLLHLLCYCALCATFGVCAMDHKCC